ncbi:MAG: ATP-binding protein [Candidatus Omnitrophica bacterium]|nr:ATP-binding protein [Candidatus Omnitrophota bacterium]
MDNLIKRQFWLRAIARAWEHRSIIWLSGVRRTGKTSLAKTLDSVEYFDCELPKTRRVMDDPEEFLASLKGKRIILDEIHRLRTPAELLKIAADHYPGVRILATGSSTLSASRQFKDTLTGRKTVIRLSPLCAADLADFKKTDLKHRFFRGGLPPFFLAKELPEPDFQEWMDDYWAKDIQELFRLERRHSFQRFLELLLARSGGIFEAAKFALDCDASRTTLVNYLRILEDTFVVQVIRPFSSHKPTEIVSAPKVYGFDTGFVCYYRGWHQLRDDDMGSLWEHYVLNEMHAGLQTRDFHYWRDKRGHEIDFVFQKRGGDPIAIECKWRADGFAPANLKAFRRAYAKGDNFVVSHDIDRPFSRRYDDVSVVFVSLTDLMAKLSCGNRTASGRRSEGPRKDA